MKHIMPVTPPSSSSSIVLVPAASDRVDEIAALWHAAWGDGHHGRVPDELLSHRTAADFRQRTAARLDSMTTAVDPDAPGAPIVGFHVVCDDEVQQLFVDAGWRGTGVATALLTHAEHTIAHHHATAWLAVVPGNARARRFYERRGWCDAGAFDNPADTDSGVVLVPTRRYEKRVRAEEAIVG